MFADDHDRYAAGNASFNPSPVFMHGSEQPIPFSGDAPVTTWPPPAGVISQGTLTRMQYTTSWTQFACPAIVNVQSSLTSWAAVTVLPGITHYSYNFLYTSYANDASTLTGYRIPRGRPRGTTCLCAWISPATSGRYTRARVSALTRHPRRFLPATASSRAHPSARSPALTTPRAEASRTNPSS